MAELLRNRLYFCRCVIAINPIKSVIPSKSGFVKRFLCGKFCVIMDFIKGHFIDDSNKYKFIYVPSSSSSEQNTFLTSSSAGFQFFPAKV